MNNRCKKINFQSIIHKRSIKFDCHILKKIVTLKLEKGEKYGLWDVSKFKNSSIT